MRGIDASDDASVLRPTRHSGAVSHRLYRLHIQRTRLGDRSFAVAGPRLWNSLPVRLRHINLSIGQFRSALKTHLFNWVGRLVTLVFSRAV